MTAGPPSPAPASTQAVRTLIVWCPDWPVVAAGLPLDEPVVVVRANRVVACSPAARAEGIALHQRRREAQGRCPEVVVVDHDPSVDVRAFEPLVAALEALTPRIEVVHPGCCGFPTRGPSRYHGGDRALAERAADLANRPLAGRGAARVGVADGPFAARLAARTPAAGAGPGPVVGSTPPEGHGANNSRLGRDGRAGAVARHPANGRGGRPGTGRPGTGRVSAPGADVPASLYGAGPAEAGPARGTAGGGVVVIEPGRSREFLAERTVRALDRPELTEVLERLGIRTLGALAALPAADVAGRFGAEGVLAHRLASGFDERPPATRPPPPDLSVVAELDPPAERLEAAAFVARGLADDLAARLARRGSACTRVVVGAETEHGERHERVWRTEGTFTAMAIADRVRWQVDGWLHAGVNRPTAGLTRLWLAPDEVVPAGGRQMAFAAGGPGAVDAVEAADRAARALARVEGVAGVDAVHVVEWRGGRGPGEQVRLVPSAAVDVTEERPAARPGWVAEPWPGRVPVPAPAVVHRAPLPAEVLDAAGRPVTVSGRGEASAPPATVRIATGPGSGPGPGPTAPGSGPVQGTAAGQAVGAWAGPWPCDERWWDADGWRRRARIQVVLADGAAHLLTLEAGRWSVEATYD